MTKLLLNKGSLGCVLVILLLVGCESEIKASSSKDLSEIDSEIENLTKLSENKLDTFLK